MTSASSELNRAIVDYPGTNASLVSKRFISDRDLRRAWYLVPQRAWMFVEASPPPGVDLPGVTDFLREMLSVRAMPHTARADLLKRIDGWGAADVTHRLMSTRLKALIGLALSEPWRFPALLSDDELRRYMRRFGEIAEISSTAGDLSALSAIPLTKVMSAFLAYVVGLGSYSMSRISMFYGNNAQAYKEEAIKRGLSLD
ncbi:hypothetical protein PJ900_18145 [Tistrella mobilis]|uniref:hypothetical protein n=1 Tax=Tistrella mobilis TaxID=171437 RepID=UPI0035564D51